MAAIYQSKPFLPTLGGTSSGKSERKAKGGVGILRGFFRLKVHPTNSMSFFFDNFADFWELGGMCYEIGIRCFL